MLQCATARSPPSSGSPAGFPPGSPGSAGVEAGGRGPRCAGAALAGSASGAVLVRFARQPALRPPEVEPTTPSGPALLTQASAESSVSPEGPSCAQLPAWLWGRARPWLLGQAVALWRAVHWARVPCCQAHDGQWSDCSS